MLGKTLVVFSDAHLGATPPVIEADLLSFLETVPDLGDSLLINGDLFDFWYSYRRVIPRRGFHVAAALARLGRRVPIVMVGGNHDRWGGDFWQRDVGAEFHPRRATFEVGGRRIAAIHGDGLTEPTRRAMLLHRLINHPVTAGVYRLLHPELGLRLVDALSPHLGDHTPDPAVLAAAAERQVAWATTLLQREPQLDLVIMGHTHHPATAEVSDRRQYVNPGAWFEGCRYAIVTEREVELRRFSPAARPRPVPDARR